MSKCKLCGKEIHKLGSEWYHTHGSQDHVAVPVNYNHMVVVAFEVISEDEQGEDITVDMFVHDMHKRACQILEDGSLDPFDIRDTYEVED